MSCIRLLSSSKCEIEAKGDYDADQNEDDDDNNLYQNATVMQLATLSGFNKLHNEHWQPLIELCHEADDDDHHDDHEDYNDTDYPDNDGNAN